MSEKQKAVDYKHAEVKSLLKNLSPKTSGGLILLTGTNRSSKARFVDRFAKKLNRNVLLVDSRDLVSRDIDKYRERRSEEHTSELQSRGHLVCRLLLEKKKQTNISNYSTT